MTIRDACRQVLSASRPMTFDEISSAVGQILGREFSKNSLASVLQSSSALLQNDGRWLLDTERNHSDFEDDETLERI